MVALENAASTAPSLFVSAGFQAHVHDACIKWPELGKQRAGWPTLRNFSSCLIVHRSDERKNCVRRQNEGGVRQVIESSGSGDDIGLPGL